MSIGINRGVGHLVLSAFKALGFNLLCKGTQEQILHRYGCVTRSGYGNCQGFLVKQRIALSIEIFGIILCFINILGNIFMIQEGYYVVSQLLSLLRLGSVGCGRGKYQRLRGRVGDIAGNNPCVLFYGSVSGNFLNIVTLDVNRSACIGVEVLNPVVNLVLLNIGKGIFIRLKLLALLVCLDNDGV